LRIGVVLPIFNQRAEPAIARAKEAEEHGLHGVFCYDHLWPMEDPGKPAIAPFPLLGRLVAETTNLCLGTLVARIGLVPDEVLIGEFRTLAALSGGRVVAALGPGDSLTAAENLAYGLEFAPTSRRLASLQRVASALVGDGIEVWIGAGGAQTNAVARKTGATLNLFGVAVDPVQALALRGPVSWAGSLPKRPSAAAELLRVLESAGATWAVIASPTPVGAIAAAARVAGVVLAV
jgi:alkanesulfonate monooxygenase SsuD/methylene tetrahydromethanopterin reductase-like flavin-dependent oxidoreductase (luciferase family)